MFENSLAFTTKIRQARVWIGIGVILLSCVGVQTQELCPTVGPENRFGVVEQLTWRFLYPDEDILRQALDRMQEAGIGWVRLNWSWKDFQPQEGPFNYDQFDKVAELASRYGVRLLPILTAVPAWASTAPPDLIAERGNLSPVDRYRPRDLNEWLAYVNNAVERYDGDGIDDAPDSPRIDYWQVWNEPNLSLFWPPKPDVQEYLNLLEATYETIHNADPSAKVVLGGLSGSGVNADGSGYLQQIYANGGAAYFDVVSVHLYVHPTRDVGQLQAALEATRQVMEENGDGDIPLWLTEIGWSDTPNAWSQPTASQDEIAAYLTAVYTTLLKADKIFWYNFRNIAADSPDVEHNFGLINYDFSPKPAYQAYVKITQRCD